MVASFVGSSSLRARFDLTEGPSEAQTIAVQFQCNGSTLSKIGFQLNTDMYKLSLVKKKIVTGMLTMVQPLAFEGTPFFYKHILLDR
jgi:hypothetical protein